MSDDLRTAPDFRERIEREMARRGLSAESLAKLVNVSGPTISRLRRTGFATRKTVERICAKLCITSEGVDAVQINIAGYSDKARYGAYEGTYLWLRQIFDHDSYIGCYPVEIFWNEEESRLDVVRPVNDGRLSYGRIFINDRGYLSIFSAYAGFASLTTLSPINSEGCLFGAMLCLGEVQGNMVAPVCCPVVLLRTSKQEAGSERFITPSDADYVVYRSLLSKVRNEKFAIFKEL